MRELTPKQRQVLTYLQARLNEGRKTSLRDIADHIGASSRNSAVCLLRRLEAKGLIKREYGHLWIKD